MPISETNKNKKNLQNMMKSQIFIAALIAVLILSSCTKPQVRGFDEGYSDFTTEFLKFNATLEKLPSTPKEIATLRLELKTMDARLDADKDAFKYLIDYTSLALESEELKLRGESYGLIGRVSDGFGCKQRPLIFESATFRNDSAQKGHESLKLLRDFIDKYPVESRKAGLSNKTIIFKNGDFVKLEKEAKSDMGTVNNLCPINRTLEIYRVNFKSSSFKEQYNLTNEMIDKMTYEEAVEYYKKSRYDDTIGVI